jgi:predicted MFS family arabinose efflux permease
MRSNRDTTANFQKRRATAASIAVIAVASGALWILGSLLTSIAGDFSMSVEAVEALISAQQFGYLSAVLVSGYLGDRVGKQKVIVAGLLLLAATQITFALVKKWGALPPIQFIAGFAYGTVFVLQVALVSELNARKRSSATGLALTAVGIGSIGATWLAWIFLRYRLSWTIPVLAWAGLILVSCMLFVSLVSPLVGSTERTMLSIRSGTDLFRSPLMHLLLLISACIVGVQVLLSTFGAPHLELVLGAPVGVAAMAPAAFWSGVTLGRIAYSASIEHLNKDQIWVASTAASLMLLCAVPLLRNPSHIIALLGFSGLFLGGIAPPTFSRSTAAFPQRTGSAAGLVAAFAGIGSVTSVSIARLLGAIFSLQSVYRLVSAELSICLLAIYLLTKRFPYETVGELLS